LKSWQSGAMERVAFLLALNGKTADADKLSEAIVKRYPDLLRSRLVRAQLLWKQGRYDDAAAVIKASRNPISTTEWRFAVGKAFLETFDKAHNEAARAAFAALLAAKINAFNLHSLAVAVARDGRSQLAFEMASSLRASGLAQLEMTITSYDALKAWKGEPAALDWIRVQLPPQMLNPLSMFAFRNNDRELLWDLIGPEPTGEGADFLWLMRAALALRQGLAQDPGRAQLEQHFKVANDTRYDKIGRYLLGQLPESELLAAATDAKTPLRARLFLRSARAVRAPLARRLGLVSCRD